MVKYFLTNKAVSDLSEIWNYTYEVLINSCQKLAENQNIGKNYPEINKDIFGYISGQHIIFYRILNQNEIEITRFLHSKMDLRNRIQE